MKIVSLSVVSWLLLSAAAYPQSATNPRPLSVHDWKAGKAVYLRECSTCHGEQGDGQGPAAAFLEIKPRNFKKQVFKLRTTDSGQPPTTSDVLNVIERGIPGTAMPPFSFLTPEERKQAAAYVLFLSDLIDEPEPAPIPSPSKAPAPSAKTIAKGKEVYATMRCAACHGETGKGDGPSAATLVDSDDQPIKVRDFTGGEFRGGAEPTDLYYRFVTGMDGSPMPSFAEQILGDDRWALVDYVMSLRVVPQPVKYPNDPIQAGRKVAEKYSCRACHVLDDGKGGNAGPDLRVAGQKLGTDWVKTFLKDPRAYGKIYPWRVSRMPQLNLAAEEIDIMAKYLATIGKRTEPVAKKPASTAFDVAQLEVGKNFFLLRCTECHNLGTVIVIPEAKRQGPDLARVAGRVDYDWAGKWIQDPSKIDPHTKMNNPGITPVQVEAVRNFVWKTSMESAAR